MLLAGFNLLDFTAQRAGKVLHALVTCHLKRVHSSYAVVGVLASRRFNAFVTHSIYEVGHGEEGPCHLYKLKAFVKHSLDACACRATAYIYERKFKLLSEQLCIIEEIGFAIGHCGYHHFSESPYAILQPPAVHVMCECLYWHLASHHIHGGFADKSTAKHYGMNAGAFNFASHGESVVNLHAAFESVTHIGLNHYAHVASCGFHDLFEAHAHKSHAVVERTAPAIASVIGVGRQKLADEITVSGVNFHAVHAAVTCQAHCVAE